MFVLDVYLSNSPAAIRSGVYSFSDPVSIRQMIEQLSRGAAGDTAALVVIPEGSNVDDIDQILAREGVLSDGAFLKAGMWLYEGYFFPDTYDFGSQPSVEEVSLIMLRTFYTKMLERNPPDDLADIIKYRRPLPLDELERRHVIVASMLEKEVRNSTDMKIVAGIINNRLKLPMRLQIDATTAYGVCASLFRRSMRCSVSDQKVSIHTSDKNGYNTYAVDGLPVAPISNPGRRSFDAARMPVNTDYYYYFTSRNDGATIFSKTFDEHRKKLLN